MFCCPRPSCCQLETGSPVAAHESQLLCSSGECPALTVGELEACPVTSLNHVCLPDLSQHGYQCTVTACVAIGDQVAWYNSTPCAVVPTPSPTAAPTDDPDSHAALVSSLMARIGQLPVNMVGTLNRLILNFAYLNAVKILQPTLPLQARLQQLTTAQLQMVDEVVSQYGSCTPQSPSDIPGVIGVTPVTTAPPTLAPVSTGPKQTPAPVTSSPQNHTQTGYTYAYALSTLHPRHFDPTTAQVLASYSTKCIDHRLLYINTVLAVHPTVLRLLT